MLIAVEFAAFHNKYYTANGGDVFERIPIGKSAQSILFMDSVIVPQLIEPHADAWRLLARLRLADEDRTRSLPHERAAAAPIRGRDAWRGNDPASGLQISRLGPDASARHR